MKQTLEEAAIKHQNGFSTCEDESVLGAFSNGMHHQSYKSFIAGAEWQSNQSLWHEVSEEPKKGEHICVQVGSGNLTSWYVPSNIRKAFEDHNAIRWAYVSDLIKPTTQSINS